jgi:hypothetical protein
MSTKSRHFLIADAGNGVMAKLEFVTEPVPKELEKKIDEAWAQERARRKKADEPRRQWDVEPISPYIDGVDFKINNKTYGSYEGTTYVYETTIDGVKVQANVYYNTLAKDKTVRYLGYDNNITPSRSTGGYAKGGYIIQFQTNLNVSQRFDILRISFDSMEHYKLYLSSKLSQ